MQCAPLRSVPESKPIRGPNRDGELHTTDRNRTCEHIEIGNDGLDRIELTACDHQFTERAATVQALRSASSRLLENESADDRVLGAIIGIPLSGDRISQHQSGIENPLGETLGGLIAAVVTIERLR